jgi:hypothetical protein
MLRVFKSRVLRKIFGPKREEVTKEWRKLHNDELYNLYCLTRYYRDNDYFIPEILRNKTEFLKIYKQYTVPALWSQKEALNLGFSFRSTPSDFYFTENQ